MFYISMAKFSESPKQKNSGWTTAKNVAKGTLVVIGIGAIITVSLGTVLLADGGPNALMDFGSWGFGSSGTSSKKTNPSDNEKTRRPEQVTALSKSQSREQSVTVEQERSRSSTPSKPIPMAKPIPNDGKPQKGMLSELGHKIRKKPWKTLGTVLLATAFPAGTVIAGAIATGVVAKSGYDAHANKL